MTTWEALEVLPPDVKPGEDRQPDRAPPRMMHDQRQRDPHMAIDVFLLGRSRRGIVMHSRPFDFRSVTFGGRIVDGEEHVAGGTLVEMALAKNPPQQLVRDPLGIASHAAQEVIIRFVVGTDPRTAKPRRDGAATDGKQHPERTTTNRQRFRPSNPAESQSAHSASSLGHGKSL